MDKTTLEPLLYRPPRSQELHVGAHSSGQGVQRPWPPWPTLQVFGGGIPEKGDPSPSGIPR